MSNRVESADNVVAVQDRAWLPRHCRGDRRAFAELLAAYQAPVYGYLVRCGIPAAARDDLFQQIFVRVHQAAASYDASRPLRPWLFTIVANTVRSHLRDTRRDPLSLADVEDARIAPPESVPDRFLEAAELSAWLERAMLALPLAQREVLMLTSMRGLGHADIARILDIPVNTVKTHLRRARQVLARALARHARSETP